MADKINLPIECQSKDDICTRPVDTCQQCLSEKLFNLNNHDKELLKEYTDFLLKHGYCDTDVYCEPPTAIDRFLILKK